ncbi:hypothetical protein [Mucilaginibacter sp. FT3.2]|uniref:hypothetical protein n=1 Tax=Mucilaginibacter sp. FT3.2 TaxID=2723090 RepID=UPI00161265C7|nr:hypothetical protein [Mucilaginibacter sp. FT3.2]MBB6231144.1 hypothetical protein [Mucilaginibacter sp. FT3.2]
MKNKPANLLFLVVFLSCCGFGCINLKHVNDFATTAHKGFEGFATLPVNFQQLCLDKCKELDIKNNKLNSSACDCDAARKADSVDYLFYKTVDAYLDGLDKLSADELTSYKFDALTTQLTGDEMGVAKVSPEQAGAYAKLAGIITKAVTDGYRRKMLRQYIGEANAPLKIVLHYLQLNVAGNLAIVLNANKGRLESDYFSLVKNSSDNTYQQRQIIETFYKLKATMDNESGELKAYGRLLQVIADGHQKLLDNAGKLDKAGLIDLISQYTSNIKDICTQIQILKK